MAIHATVAVRFVEVGSESTPKSRLAETTHHTGADAGITDREGAPIDRRGADLAPGTIVGDYQIERKLGHGGMGAVYEAIHPVIEKRVAIKVLLPELSRSEEAVERFKSEARAVNRIRHPSIVDVFGYGTTEDGRCFLVMELLDGESLGRRLQYDAPSVAEACDILIAITHALDAAHATNIVHRDLKPDNVFLVEGKHVKLLDFGIAKLTARAEPERAAAEYTQPGQAMGTPRYIAPEQARGDAVDGRTDIYSLGVMAYELLVGRPPFVGDNPMELIAKHITLPPPTPSDLAPTLPPAADRLLLQMLDKNPVNRPPLGVVRAMLDEIRAPWVTSITTTRPNVTPPAPAPADTPRRTPKRRWWIPLAVVGGLGAGLGSFVLVRGLGRDDAHGLAPTPSPDPAPQPKIEPAPKGEVAPKAALEPTPEPKPALDKPVADPPVSTPAKLDRRPPDPRSRADLVKKRVSSQPTTPTAAPQKPPPPIKEPEPPPPAKPIPKDGLMPLSKPGRGSSTP